MLPKHLSKQPDFQGLFRLQFLLDPSGADLTIAFSSFFVRRIKPEETWNHGLSVIVKSALILKGWMFQEDGIIADLNCKLNLYLNLNCWTSGSLCGGVSTSKIGEGSEVSWWKLIVISSQEELEFWKPRCWTGSTNFEGSAVKVTFIHAAIDRYLVRRQGSLCLGLGLTKQWYVTLVLASKSIYDTQGLLHQWANLLPISVQQLAGNVPIVMSCQN